MTTGRQVREEKGANTAAFNMGLIVACRQLQMLAAVQIK